MSRIALVLPLALAVGCKDHGACLQSHFEPMVMVVFVGKVPVTQITPVLVCDRYEFPEGRP